jgi:hypothetical protein
MLAACAGDDARNHVHRSPPPVRAAPATTVTPDVPEPPVGAAWPSAGISSVRIASTGQPASLGNIADSVDVLTVVTRGSASSPEGPARIELHLAGPTDTTLVERLRSPVPAVIAHDFRLIIGNGDAGLRDGVYHARVRFVGPSGTTIAQSVPLFFTVRR